MLVVITERWSEDIPWPKGSCLNGCFWFITDWMCPDNGKCGRPECGWTRKNKIIFFPCHRRRLTLEMASWFLSVLYMITASPRYIWLFPNDTQKVICAGDWSRLWAFQMSNSKVSHWKHRPFLPRIETICQSQTLADDDVGSWGGDASITLRSRTEPNPLPQVSS